METPRASLSFFFIFFLLCLFFNSNQADRVAEHQRSSNNGSVIVDVGVVFDFDTEFGKMNWKSISMGIEDFYASHESFTTRVVLHPRDSQSDIVGAASAAIDLMNNVNVQAVIGPTTSSQTEFVASLGDKTHVPIVSFSATSPSLSSVTTPYFVRATLNDSIQIGAIADIVKLNRWREVVPVYEDTNYGVGILPSLVDAFDAIDTRIPYQCVVPTNATDDWIDKELYKLISMHTRVFVVHMMPILGSRLFQKARSAGLLGPGFVWIVSDSLTSILSTLDNKTLNSMDGVLGVQPYIHRSPALIAFANRWHSIHPPPTGPTIFQLRSYDVAWAIALASENAKNPSSFGDSTDLARVRVSKTEHHLLHSIDSVHFRGICGDFKLINGQLQSSIFEIVNIVGGSVRRVGFWSPGVGLRKHLKGGPDLGLRSIIWPGDSKDEPKGWEVPTMGKKLRILVPVKQGFTEFVNVRTDDVTGAITVTGYCIDIFEAVMKLYPVPYEYVPFYPKSYDAMISQVYFHTVDAAVGDITIIANRSQYVDFTLPYTESGVSIIVPVMKDDNNRKNMWIFLQPLTTDLWLASLVFFFFTGFVVWVIEHRINNEFRGPPAHQMGTIFYFAFSTLIFAHKERLEDNLSRFVVIIWVFVVMVLTSSYTASLTSIQTVQQLQLTVTDLKELVKRGDYVGYPEVSFVKELLIHKFKFDESKLINYSTTEQYAMGLSLGSNNGGVAAICDEIPYLRLFLSKNFGNYAMLGRTYKTNGFGFVFPRGSPLVPDISRAIVNITESDYMDIIEKKWFGDHSTSPVDANNFTSNSLNFQNFGGLFLITGCVSFLALIVWFIISQYKNYTTGDGGSVHDNSGRPNPHVEGSQSPINGLPNNGRSFTEGDGSSSHVEGSQSPVSVISNLSALNSEPPNNGRSFTEGDGPRFEDPPAETVSDIVEIQDEG